MKLGRIMGVVLLMLGIVFIGKYYYSDPSLNTQNNILDAFELIGDNGVREDSGVTYNDVMLTEDNQESVEVISYTNTNNHAIELNSYDIVVTCTGGTIADNKLVEDNLKVSAMFSKGNDKQKHDSLIVDRKEKANIYISNEYVGSTYPSSEVSCSYSILVGAE